MGEPGETSLIRDNIMEYSKAVFTGSSRAAVGEASSKRQEGFRGR